MTRAPVVEVVDFRSVVATEVECVAGVYIEALAQSSIMVACLVRVAPFPRTAVEFASAQSLRTRAPIVFAHDGYTAKKGCAYIPAHRPEQHVKLQPGEHLHVGLA